MTDNHVAKCIREYLESFAATPAGARLLIQAADEIERLEMLLGVRQRKQRPPKPTPPPPPPKK